MRSRYTIYLILLIICSPWESLLAQYEAHPSEDPQLLNTGGGSESGGWTFTCECYFPSTYNNLWFYYQQIANSERDSWLNHQENNIKDEIERRLKRSFNNFRDAQHAFFKKYDGLVRASREIVNYRSKLNGQMNTLKKNLDDVGANFRVLDLRFDDLQRVNMPNRYDFGDLKYDGKKIMDMGYAEVNRDLGNEGNNYYPVFTALERTYVKDFRSEYIENQQILADFIANKWIESYNDINSYEDKIRIMSYYLVKQWNSWSMTDPVPPSVSGYPYGSPENYVRLLDFDNILNNLTNDANLPSKFYKDISDPNQIKLNYAVHQMGSNTASFINNNEGLKDQLSNYLDSHNYRLPSLQESKNLFQSYINGTMDFGYVFRRYKTFEGYDYDRPERFAVLRLYATHSTSPYYGYSDLLEELSLAATNYASEGKGIRSLIKAGGKTIPTEITDEIIGRLFDFYGSGDYYIVKLSSFARQNIDNYDRLGPSFEWEWLEDPFYIEALKAVASGGQANFYDRIIVEFEDHPCLIDIYNSLNVSKIAKDYLNKFNITKPVANLRFTIGVDNTYPTANAVTYNPDNYIIEIKFNPNKLKRPRTSIARTFIHELIHAEMYRKLLSLAQDSSIPWSEGFINSIKNDFPGLHDYYTRWYYNVPQGQEASDPQHELMAEHYRKTIADFLLQFDISLTTRQAEDLAWEGLMGSGVINNSTGLPIQPTKAWEKINQNERLRILASNNQFNSANQNCK